MFGESLFGSSSSDTMSEDIGTLIHRILFIFYFSNPVDKVIFPDLYQA